MLSLYTSGYKYSRRRCEDVVEWFYDRYLKRYKIEIEVFHRGLRREGAYGYCSVQDCDHRPRNFLIEMHNQLPPEDYIKTLLHELQHVLQHVRGDLRDKRGVRCWKGIKCFDLPYVIQPWEIEAHTMEEVLYLRYLTESQ
jgi:hypothetical protein